MKKVCSGGGNVLYSDEHMKMKSAAFLELKAVKKGL